MEPRGALPAAVASGQWGREGVVSVRDRLDIALLLIGAAVFDVLPWPVVDALARWDARR